MAGFIAMFFFLTLYMQDVLGYSPVRTGLSYLPVTAGVGAAAGTASKLMSRTGTRPILVAGTPVAAAGVYYLSRVPVHGSYLTDVLPGMVVMSVGLGAEFVAATTAANAGVAPDKAGLAAALLNASQQLGGALGLAISPPLPPLAPPACSAPTVPWAWPSTPGSTGRCSPAASSCWRRR